MLLSSAHLGQARDKPIEEHRRVGSNAGELGGRTWLPQPYDEIERIHRRSSHADRFTQDTLQAIAVDGATEELLPNHVADSAAGFGCPDCENLQPVRFKAATGAEYCSESRGAAQPVAVGQIEGLSGSRSDGQPGAALSATRAQDLATAD